MKHDNHRPRARGLQSVKIIIDVPEYDIERSTPSGATQRQPTELTLQTTINAPIELCFDLARSIDLHTDSVSHTQEKAVSGVTTGLIGLGEEVEWRARHLGMLFSMRSRITALDRPGYFRDEMVKGPFRTFLHDHMFEQHGNSTLMLDNVKFASPFSILGKVFDKLLLKAHLHHLLENRNRFIKSVAESDLWHKYLSFPKS